ncbi:SMP-30/gluconolactonase/LRE family protein [Tropicimonas sp. IMCC34043]|uniref:SMP-30/gluconolactonase/LRE family protein n=1 Tax=Tropicimonas sp. IMCC34043 TaxID=2248760 RepID=UPI000E267EDE|nr:SMP-30/gluconolactonase/LRE family protein [Tropicimonas sp. IMCC34043]
MKMEIFDDRLCTLGEGPIWLPEREALVWVDIPARRLLGRSGEETFEWQVPEMISALGRIDAARLLLAGETGLSVFDLSDGSCRALCPVEAGISGNRSNDGRADPWGGFWISTMGKATEAGAGSIYRWYRGELRRLVTGLTIPNGICFAPDRRRAYYADSRRSTIYVLGLDPDGWPTGRAEEFVVVKEDRVVPDGAVTDADGCLWSAQWGGGRVVRFGPDGQEIARFATGTPYPTCPAFGGRDLSDLYVTTMTNAAVSASRGLPPPLGRTLRLAGAGPGRVEPTVDVGRELEPGDGSCDQK